MFEILSAVLYLGNVEFTEHADPSVRLRMHPIGHIMKFIAVLILLMLSEQGKTIAQIATDESKYKTESSFDNVCAYDLI